jgi:hypothetical protein
MLARLGASVLLLLIPTLASATEPVTVRTRIDRIVRAADALGRGRALPAGLTADVNALLSTPGETREALREVLILAREPWSVAAVYRPWLEDLARLLLGDDSRPGSLVRVRNDCVLVRGPGAARPPDATLVERLSGKDVPLREPLQPDGGALLAFLTSPRDEPDDDLALAISSGLALANTARHDSPLVDRITGALKKQVVPRVRLALLTAMTALGRTEPARAEIHTRVARAAADEAAREALTALALAMRAAGDEKTLRQCRKTVAQEADHLEVFDDAVAGDAVIGALVEDARNGWDPRPDLWRRMSDLLEPDRGMLSRWTIEYLVHFSTANDECAPPADRARQRAAGERLGRAFLWPEWTGTWLHEGRECTTHEAWGESPRREEHYWWEFDYTRGLPGSSVFTRGLSADPLGPWSRHVRRDDMPADVEIVARRTDDFVRITLRNRSRGPVTVNPASFQLTAFRTENTPDRPTRVRITLGALTPDLALEIRLVDRDAVIRPNSARTFTCSLSTGIQPDAEIHVEFHDPAGDGVDWPDGPRVRAFTLLPVGVTTAEPIDNAERQARMLIDRLAHAEHRALDPDGRDLTGDANALLALGREPVLRAFGAALDRACEYGCEADQKRSVILSLLRTLAVGAEPGAPYENHHFRVLHGCLMFDPCHQSIHIGPPPPWTYPPCPEDILGLSPVLKERLVPAPRALLMALLDPDDDLIRDLDSGTFLIHAGRALGTAARTAPAVARRILEAVRKGDLRIMHAEETRGARALLYAAASLGTGEACDALRERALKAALDGDSYAFWDLAPALRLAVGEAGLVGFRKRLAPKASRRTLEQFDFRAGGDVAIQAHLEAKATPENLRRLTLRIGRSAGPPISARALLRTLERAIRHVDSPDPDLASAARTLAGYVLWPVQPVPLSSHTSTKSEAADGTLSGWKSRTESGHSFGGWPDPVPGARRLLNAVVAGRIRIRTGWPLESIWTRGRSPQVERKTTPDLVEFVGTRHGAEVVLTLRNQSKVPVCVNPVAFGFTSAEVVRVTVNRDGQIDEWTEARLRLGHLWRIRLAAAALEILPPGAERIFRVPLDPKLPANAHISVVLEDEFAIEGDPPAPLVRSIGATIETTPPDRSTGR